MILKFEQLFAETLASYILKTKTIFVNPDDHSTNFDLQTYCSLFKQQDLWHTDVERGLNLGSIF